jgi:hypothetical protein
MDMKVLRMELLTRDNKVVVASVFLNFGLLGHHWEGQRVGVDLPLFNTNQAIKRNKIVGELKMQL